MSLFMAKGHWQLYYIKDFGMGDYSGLSSVIADIFTSGKIRVRGDGMMGAEVRARQSRAKECGQPPENAEGQDSLLEPPERHSPANLL